MLQQHHLLLMHNNLSHSLKIVTIYEAIYFHATISASPLLFTIANPIEYDFITLSGVCVVTHSFICAYRGGVSCIYVLKSLKRFRIHLLTSYTDTHTHARALTVDRYESKLPS